MSNDPINNCMHYEINDVKEHLSSITKLNFKVAGALANVNQLIEAGWVDTTGVWQGHEIYRLHSCWAEYVEKIDGVEYHVTLSMGPTLPNVNEKGEDVEVGDVNDYRVQAHEAKVPRMAWLRRVSVFALDEKDLSFKKFRGEVPAQIVEKVSAQLEAAIVTAPKSLLDDLAFQVNGYGPFADWCIESDADLQLLRLDSVLDEANKNGNRESLARLLMPVVRAVLTDDDPKGREFLYGVKNPCCLAFMASHAFRADLPEMAAVLMELVLDHLEMDKVEHSFGFGPWQALARMALRLNMSECAALAIRNACVQFQKMEKDDKRREQSVHECVGIFWAFHDYLKRQPEDTVGCNDVVSAIEGIGSPLADELDFKLLVRLGRCYTATVDGFGLEKAVDALCEVTKAYIDRFDGDHKEECEKKPYLSQLPIGVKAPLGWQAFLYARCGEAAKAIEAFPNPPLSVFGETEPLPTQEPVEGLSFVDVWRGFLPKELDENTVRAFSQKVVAALVPSGKPKKVGPCEWSGSCSTPLKEMQLIVPQNEKAGELLSMGFLAKTEDKDEAFPIVHFPYLTKDYSEPNCVVKMWKYHPWAHYQAADAEFTLEDGRRFCAVMPFFAWDRSCLVRGAPWKAKVVGFANELYKRDKPELPPPHKVTEGYLAEENAGPVDVHFTEEVFDFFDQDSIDENISRSGYGIHGRVKSVRTIRAYDQDVLVVAIESASLRSRVLGNVLEVYIGAQNYDGPELQVGDTVESWGWLYVDVFTSAHNPEEFFAQAHEKGFPCDPAENGDDTPFGAGAPIFVREDMEIEKNFTEFGKAALAGADVVEKVAVCQGNPQLFDYVVRLKDGRVLKYNFSMGDKDGNPEGVVPGAERLVLHKEKVEKGYKLKWFGIPE